MNKFVAVVMLSLGFVCAPALAQHSHHDDPVAAPKSYAACVAAIDTLATSVDKAMSAGDLAAVGNAAYQIVQLSKTLGKAALDDATVGRDKVKGINLLGKELAEAADGVHDAADDKKAEDARTKLAILRPLIERLDAIAPDLYVCPMHCEGTKTYVAPGECPICKMALTRMSQTPYYAQVSAEGTVEAGKPAALTIRLLDPAGNLASKIDVVHEHPLHFIIVSEDLSFYAHEHPTRQPDGTFRLPAFTFPFGGKFITFSDFTPTGAANQVSKFEFKIADGGVPRHEAVKLEEDFDGVGKNGDYEFRVRCNGQLFFAGQDSFLRYGIDLQGQPVTDLEPIMGAMGHLVIISKDGERYIHAHPLDFSAKPEASGGTGDGHAHHADAAVMQKARDFLLGNGNASDVVFHAVFPEPGMYRAFAQFQHKGRVLTYAVTIDARPAPEGTAAPVMPMDGKHNHDAGAKPAVPGGK